MSGISTPAPTVRLSGTRPRNGEGDAITAPSSPEGSSDPPLHTLTIVSFDEATAASGSSPSDPPRLTLGAPEARYRVEGFLGEGGMGEVFRGADALLEREVAIKYLREGLTTDPNALRRFWSEVVHAGLLDHPSIPPVHDVGLDKHGRPFYVMRLIRGRSLREILVDPDSESEWGLPRFLAGFVQVCGAVQFAHDSDIFHLDIKPDNIMIGEYGAVYLVDWGLSEASDPAAGRGTRGTPAYMAPEQTRRDESVTAAADIFALGSLLYELCTRRRAFDGDTPPEIFAGIRRGEFVRGEEWSRVPASLREAIESALQPTPEGRLESAELLAKKVNDFLDGRQDRIRRRQRSREELEAARSELQLGEDALAVARRLEADLERRRPEPWAPTDEKVSFWDAEDEYERTLASSELHRERALQHLLRARKDARDDRDVRRALADIYLERFERAERAGDAFLHRFLEIQLRELELPEIERLLIGDGTLHIRCEPSPSNVTIAAVVEHRRVLGPAEPRTVAPTEYERLTLSPGRYEVRADAPGCRTVVAPVHLSRGASIALDLRPRTAAEIGEGFIQIPGGSFVMGGDEKTFKSHPRIECHVAEFAVARFPVTFEEYREYLQAIADDDRDEATRRLPKVPGAEDTWGIEHGVVAYWDSRRDWPVFCVSYDGAKQYCEWRSQRDGRRYRLPTDEEWEKAARGVDERWFPWGNRFDASFCKNADSTEEKSQPEPVGQYPIDRSPYGVRDMAGGIREWCDAWFSEKDGLRLVRGGSWNFSSVGAHCAYRLGCAPQLEYPFIGFRLAHDFD